MPPANPILRGMYPDPSVCVVDGTYYLVNSTFEYVPGIPIHSSTDLQSWQLIGHALHDPAQLDFSRAGDSRGIFAPTIRHHNGTFYIVCTQMADNGGNFYVTATNPAGPWSTPVMIPDARGIDPSIFFHEGRAWWTGCREVADPTFDGETEVWMRELDLESGQLVGDETVIWTRTQQYAVWAEAPHLYLRDGWFYLVTAEGGTAFEHSVMVARSRDLHGPYRPCPRNPVLTHRHLGSEVAVQSVGHADLFEATDGQWWMVMLATRPFEGHHILGRETHLARVSWEDGWPVVNPGLGQLEPPVWREQRWQSDGVPSTADFLSVRHFADFAEPTERGLTLTRTVDAPVGTALLRRLTSTHSTVGVTLDELTDGSAAGLVLRQSDDFQIRVDLIRSTDVLVARLVVRELADTVVSTVELGISALTIVAQVRPDSVTVLLEGCDEGAVSLGSVPLTTLSTETAGGFVGTTFGPFVAGPVGGSILFTDWSQHDHD